MNNLSIKTVLGRSLVVAALLALAAGPASAATYTLRAGVTAVNHGDGPITAWGYALDSSDVPGVVADGTIRVPGPTLYVPPGEGLTINLVNELNEATSIVVHGQKRVGTPVFDGGRVRSFTNEASQVAAAPANVWFYSWTAAELKPGTFLYNSGSHPSKQVHMGLYGAVIVDAPDSDGDPLTFEAYPGVFYDRDIVVIYSDVDPALRNTESAAQPLNFKPKYFLVNGDHTGNSVLTSAPADLNSRVLLRIVNAGLKNYVPTMLGEDLEWLAEDGNTYPYVRKSYSAFLGAGKTMDALWVPVTTDRHTLYDRRLHTSINGEAGGGLRAFLDSGITNVPIANAGADQLHIALGTPISLTGSATGGSGAYSTWDWSLVAFPAGSSAVLAPNADPAIVTITPDVAGTYSVQLVVTDDGGVSSAPTSVNIFTNLPPVAVAAAEFADVALGDTVNLDGGDSYDPDGDAITSYDWTVTAPNTVVTPLSGELTSFIADQTGTYTVELAVSDGELTGSDVIYVTSSVAANQPPTAGNDFFQVIWKTSNNVLYPLANDDDADGTIVPSSLTIVTNPMNGASAVPTAVGTILYTPKNGFKGTDFFTYSICDNLGECSEAEVLVNVVK